MKIKDLSEKKRWLYVILIFAAVHTALLLILLHSGIPGNATGIKTGLVLLIMTASVTLWIQSLWLTNTLRRSVSGEVPGKVTSRQFPVWILSAVFILTLIYVLVDGVTTATHHIPSFFMLWILDEYICYVANGLLGRKDCHPDKIPDPVIRRTERRQIISLRLFLITIVMSGFIGHETILYIPSYPIALFLIILNFVDIKRLLKEECSGERKDDLENRLVSQIQFIILFAVCSINWILDILLFIQKNRYTA